MTATAREERFIQGDCNGGDPEVILANEFVNRLELSLSANVSIHRNHWHGVDDRKANREEPADRFHIMAGTN